MKKLQLLTFAFISLFVFACSEDDDNQNLESNLPGNLTLTFQNSFGTAAFNLDTEYTTPEGDKIKPDQIRYWISNVVLKKSDGSSYAIPNAYYLIQNCKQQVIANSDGSVVLPAQKRETIYIPGIPAGEYAGITFSIGVDSEYNDNLSLQAGELGVMQNMTGDNAWMWFTSYIFSKIGGTYTNANAETFNFLFETGSNEEYKTIVKAFDVSVKINALNPAAITVKTDAAKLFTGIKITNAPKVGNTHHITAGSPSALMSELANNYSTAFELVVVENVNP